MRPNARTTAPCTRSVLFVRSSAAALAFASSNDSPATASASDDVVRRESTADCARSVLSSLRTSASAVTWASSSSSLNARKRSGRRTPKPPNPSPSPPSAPWPCPPCPPWRDQGPPWGPQPACSPNSPNASRRRALHRPTTLDAFSDLHAGAHRSQRAFPGRSEVPRAGAGSMPRAPTSLGPAPASVNRAACFGAGPAPAAASAPAPNEAPQRRRQQRGCKREGERTQDLPTKEPRCARSSRSG